MKTAPVTTAKPTCTEDKVSICLSVLGNKWTGLILTKLLEGPMRFTELERSLEGISPRTLSQRLDDLVRHEVIAKAAFNEVPPRVEYALTPKGRDFIPILEQMAEWGAKYPRS